MTGRKNRRTKRGGRTADMATVRIGKNGPTDLVMKEISKQLDKRQVVKVKILKTALGSGEAEEIAQKVSRETESEITQLRGHTFTLHKRKKG